MVFIGYKKCSTSNKAQKWLDDNKIDYRFRDIKTENPSFDELKSWKELGKNQTKKMFNTSGLLYKEMNLKTKLENMTEEEQIKLLSTDGMLVKRPILIDNNFAFFGFKEEQWKLVLKK